VAGQSHLLIFSGISDLLNIAFVTTGCARFSRVNDAVVRTGKEVAVARCTVIHRHWIGEDKQRRQDHSLQASPV
jgi:hypothetical protein